MNFKMSSSLMKVFAVTVSTTDAVRCDHTAKDEFELKPLVNPADVFRMNVYNIRHGHSVQNDSFKLCNYFTNRRDWRNQGWLDDAALNTKGVKDAEFAASEIERLYTEAQTKNREGLSVKQQAVVKLVDDFREGKVHLVSSPLRRALDTLMHTKRALIRLTNPKIKRFDFPQLSKFLTDEHGKEAAIKMLKSFKVFLVSWWTETSSEPDCESSLAPGQYPSGFGRKIKLNDAGVREIKCHDKGVCDTYEEKCSTFNGRFARVVSKKRDDVFEIITVDNKDDRFNGVTLFVNSKHFRDRREVVITKDRPDAFGMHPRVPDEVAHLFGEIDNHGDQSRVFDLSENQISLKKAQDRGHTGFQLLPLNKRTIILTQLHVLFGIKQMFDEQEFRKDYDETELTSAVLGNHSLTTKTLFQLLLPDHEGATNKMMNGAMINFTIKYIRSSLITIVYKNELGETLKGSISYPIDATTFRLTGKYKVVNVDDIEEIFDHPFSIDKTKGVVPVVRGFE